MILKCLCYLHGTCAISISLYHTNEFRFRVEEGPIVVQITDNRIQVDFQYCLVDLLFQTLGDTVKPKRTSSLDKYQFVMQGTNHITLQKCLSSRKERLLLYRKGCCRGRDIRTDAYQTANATLDTQSIHLTIQFFCVPSALGDVTEYQTTTTLGLAARHEVKGDVQRIDVTIIRVVDQLTAMAALFYLKTHSHRFQQRHALRQLFSRQAKGKSGGYTGK